jgi:hypothetical protein
MTHADMIKPVSPRKNRTGCNDSTFIPVTTLPDFVGTNEYNPSRYVNKIKKKQLRLGKLVLVSFFHFVKTLLLLKVFFFSFLLLP